MKCTGCGYHIVNKNATTCKLCGTDLTGKGEGGHGAKPAERPSAGRGPSGRPEWSSHLLLRIGGAPIDLTPGKKLVAGRDEGCGLSIPSQRVSRQHCELEWVDGAPVLKDLGSQNGTLVNGQKITEPRALQDGDELVIGPSAFTYRRLASSASAAKLKAAVDQAMSTRPMIGDTMSGQLSQMSLFEALSALELGERTGQVEVLSEERVGRVGLVKGRLVHAGIEGGASGPDALHELLAMTDGMFRFTTKAAPGVGKTNLPERLTVLAAEAGRRMAAEGGGS